MITFIFIIHLTTNYEHSNMVILIIFETKKMLAALYSTVLSMSRWLNQEQRNYGLSFSTLTLLFSPKMNRVRLVLSSQGSMTHTGHLNFLHSQASFDLTFGPKSTMLRPTPGKNKQCTTEEIDYLVNKLFVFCNFWQIHIFCDFV